MVMASAEVAAHANNEPILHIGDRVRLDGLVKNLAVNGMVGSLQAYSAESQRWKVLLSDNKVFWVRPKLIVPLEARRKPLIIPEDSGLAQADNSSEASIASAAQAVAAGLAQLEAKQQKWREEQEAKEIKMLEREESMRKIQEAIEASEVDAIERTPSMTASQSAAQFLMCSDESPPETREKKIRESPVNIQPLSPTSGGSAEADEEEMWDMDWTAVSPDREPQAVGSSASAEAIPAALAPSAQGGSSSRSAVLARHPEPVRSSGSSKSEASEADLPSMDPAEREAFQQKLEEKRRLAELHNGQDFSAPRVVEFDKGSMPGATPEVARVLEERRRKLEQEENEPKPPTDV